uniref:Uncharacterized protein n=1 Tax=mine drainage metagenome TaxID=410659 RepID=E6Q7W4_9ZZZZ
MTRTSCVVLVPIASVLFHATPIVGGLQGDYGVEVAAAAGANPLAVIRRWDDAT